MTTRPQPGSPAWARVRNKPLDQHVTSTFTDSSNLAGRALKAPYVDDDSLDRVANTVVTRINNSWDLDHEKEDVLEILEEMDNERLIEIIRAPRPL